LQVCAGGLFFGDERSRGCFASVLFCLLGGGLGFAFGLPRGGFLPRVRDPFDRFRGRFRFIRLV
jgi:hypothetical protein